ncbi:Concanavalin A-like lectin/glucanases superfamily protein [Granulicella pectinivorans]|uniref:Concanavalin A-like lectin/glucanases superfamily protein n=1 Tax=Granulicella pectinivorans TaxID=474950 RepID=A0A1I6M185_9BACT|nr:LamG-like jellyroll fold domain-containing protein [Granulicella pectinivorans]SFS09455.1 Concanavalin A-like lectin/glucanases superfamily protein [Granulicella pectinivorans]
MRALTFLAAVMFASSLHSHAYAQDQTVWHLNQPAAIKALQPSIEGHPEFTAQGVHFDGRGDALFFPTHPLAGARTWTWEMVFRPDADGQTEQRIFHLQPVDAAGKDIPTMRNLFEIRIHGSQWCLDSFASVSAKDDEHITLLPCTPETMHPFGAFHTATATYDGTTLRSYVDGVLQAEGAVHLTPQLPGHSSLGVRINRLFYFKGTVYEARFTHHVLPVGEFLVAPK